MTAGTVVITGGILATVILLCIIIVLCFCRLQYYCCKTEELESESDSDSDSDSEELREEPGLTMTSHLPLDAAAAYAANGPCVYTPALPPRLVRSHTYCPSCTRHELPYLGSRAHGLRNGSEWVSYRPASASASYWAPALGPEKLHFSRSITMKEMFTRGYSISTDV